MPSDELPTREHANCRCKRRLQVQDALCHASALSATVSELRQLRLRPGPCSLCLEDGGLDRVCKVAAGSSVDAVGGAWEFHGLEARHQGAHVKNTPRGRVPGAHRPLGACDERVHACRAAAETPPSSDLTECSEAITGCEHIGHGQVLRVGANGAPDATSWPRQDAWRPAVAPEVHAPLSIAKGQQGFAAGGPVREAATKDSSAVQLHLRQSREFARHAVHVLYDERSQVIGVFGSVPHRDAPAHAVADQCKARTPQRQACCPYGRTNVGRHLARSEILRFTKWRLSMAAQVDRQTGNPTGSQLSCCLQPGGTPGIEPVQ
mmetsp:Transcript_79264/g.256606  ORF Transcript_79264/g.256606 Transcript_79264/m.256606 type:complete len:320 (+) Transcript_79264:123-1082(+)